MKLKSTFIIMIFATLLIACGGDNHKGNKPNGMNANARLKGDRTIYGLACEGCTDSVLELLPDDGSDPVKYDIIDAFRNHKIKGMPKVGDWVCLVPNAKNAKVADMVIDLEQLKGIWCYIVMPKMRDIHHMDKRTQARMMRNMPDSMKATFMIPREYGFMLKRDWIAQSVGYVQENSALESQSPVEYPQLGFFTGWRIWNGKLIVISGTPNFTKGGKHRVSNLINDTCDIDFLNPDSLVLSSGGISRSYYHKDNINDVNKKANKIAAMQTKKALQDIKK